MATGVCLLQRSKVAANSLSHASCPCLAGFRKEALADSMKVRSSCSKLLRPLLHVVAAKLCRTHVVPVAMLSQHGPPEAQLASKKRAAAVAHINAMQCHTKLVSKFKWFLSASSPSSS